MQKNRFLLAVISYSMVLLLLAAGSVVLLPSDTQASAQPAPTATVVPNPPTNVTPSADVLQAEKNEPDGEDQKQPQGDIADRQEQTGSEEVVDAWELLQANITEEWRGIIGERCIVLPKPQVAKEDGQMQIVLSDMPVDHSIALQIEGCEYSEYSYDVIERIADKQYFVSVPQIPKQDTVEDDEADLPQSAEAEEVTADPLREMKQLCSLQEDGSYQLYVEFVLDKTYVYNVYETETHYFIALLDAKTMYDRIVVLDAGHGGWGLIIFRSD